MKCATHWNPSPLRIQGKVGRLQRGPQTEAPKGSPSSYAIDNSDCLPGCKENSCSTFLRLLVFPQNIFRSHRFFLSENQWDVQMFRQNMTSLSIPRMSIDSLYHNNENGIDQHENILPSNTPYLLSIFAQESRRETV